MPSLSSNIQQSLVVLVISTCTFSKSNHCINSQTFRSKEEFSCCLSEQIITLTYIICSVDIISLGQQPLEDGQITIPASIMKKSPAIMLQSVETRLCPYKFISSYILFGAFSFAAYPFVSIYIGSFGQQQMNDFCMSLISSSFNWSQSILYKYSVCRYISI